MAVCFNSYLRHILCTYRGALSRGRPTIPGILTTVQCFYTLQIICICLYICASDTCRWNITCVGGRDYLPILRELGIRTLSTGVIQGSAHMASTIRSGKPPFSALVETCDIMQCSIVGRQERVFSLIVQARPCGKGSTENPHGVKVPR